jgi:guanyl-specific ribonuclease Sa
LAYHEATWEVSFYPILATIVHQDLVARQTIADPCVPPEEKLLAGLTIALAVGLELVEPDDLLPVGLPADDIARRAVVKQARRALQEGGIEGFVRSVKDQLGDSADNILRELGLGDYVDDAAQKGDNLVNDTVGAICSFSADTLVSTPYGFAAISELAEGQYVLAYDEATGTLIYEPILATWVHEDPLIIHLIIDGETIETTPEHPFRLANGDWVPAAALEIGSQVQRANGTTGLVAAIEFSYDSQLMYNLTVAAAHTYFAGEGQWLVHNACPPWLHRSSLTPEENNALNATLEHIRSGTRPEHVQHWGGARDIYRNTEGYLPSDVDYQIYDVPAKPDNPTRGTRRIVIGNDGKWYYTNTHYGQAGGNPFFRLK